MIISIPLLCMMLLPVSIHAGSDGKEDQLGVASTSYLRGSLGEDSNSGLLPAKSNTSISSRLMPIIKYDGEDITDVYSPSAVTFPLHVFLSDTQRILQDVEKFEQAVVEFISASMPKDSYGSFTSASVLEQRLVWVEDTSSIGLEVYFQVDAFVSTDIHRNKLKRSIQKMLNSRSEMFKGYLYKSSKEIAENDEAESIAMKLLLRPPISFAAVAFGLFGIVCSIGYLYWKTRLNQPTGNKEAKSNHGPTEINSKPTLETSESFADDSYLDHSLTFPMQYHANQPEEWDDISGPDDLRSDDGSFNASVVFEMSAIRANIEDNTDSDSSDEDDSSEGKFSSPPLSPEALQEFDLALRQAEF